MGKRFYLGTHFEMTDTLQEVGVQVGGLDLEYTFEDNQEARSVY